VPISSPSALLGRFLYALSAYGWYLSMQHISLAQLGVAFSIFWLLAHDG